MLPLLLAVILVQAQPAGPVGKAALLDMLRGGAVPPGQMSGVVRERGVAFQASPEDEAELRAAGADAATLEAVRAGFRPSGPPLSFADLKLLLDLRAPREPLERLIRARGVEFAISPQVGADILAAGGDSSLVGLVALHQKVPERSLEKPQETPREQPAAAPETGSVRPKPEPPSLIGPREAPVEVRLTAAPDPDVRAGTCELRARVDHVTDFVFSGARAGYSVQQGSPPQEVLAVCSHPLPAAPMTVSVTRLKGRGKVVLIEPPAQSNGFAARLQVLDPSSGPDNYVIRLSWAR